MNIVQITDLHIVKDKEGKINNFNTFQAASEVVKHVAKHQKNIDYLIPVSYTHLTLPTIYSV